MHGIDALFVDTNVIECINFIEIVHRTKAQVECPFTTVEVSFKYNYESFLENKLPLFIKDLNLKLKVPNCMIGSDAIIINTDFPEFKGHIKKSENFTVRKFRDFRI